MEILKMNRRMRELYSPDWDLSSITLPDKLNDMIELGIILHQGCFVRKDVVKARRPHFPVEQYEDRAALEASMNEIHIDFYTDTDHVLIAFACLKKISDILQKEFPDETFYGIVSTELNARHCVARFYCKREEEIPYLLDDLEEYKTNAVCLIHL